MILWTDIESTGLDEQTGHILEVAVVITDDQLTELAAMSVVCKPVGYCIDQVDMDPYVLKMHTENGLIDEVKNIGIRRHEAEEKLAEFVRAFFANVPDVQSNRKCVCGEGKGWHHEHGGMGVCQRPPLTMGGESNQRGFLGKPVPALPETPFAGSTIAFDRRWLRHHMQKFERMFSYRSIDVSSITELAKRWAPETYASRPKSDEKHRALSDILGSIELLRHYRRVGFLSAEESVVRLVQAVTVAPGNIEL